MGKIVEKIDTQYDRGDVVVFHKMLEDPAVRYATMCGIVASYYVDHNAGDSIWYTIRVDKDTVFDYSLGDISEWEIVGKLEGKLAEAVKEDIEKGRW